MPRRTASVHAGRALLIALAAGLASAALLGGCAERLKRPAVLVAPYPEESVWAVAPFANESGVGGIDGLALADRFVAEVEGVEGLRALPLNRTLAAMQSLGLDSIRSREDAARLLAMLHADGIVLGTVTDWDPYRPLRFGAAVELVTQGASGAPQALGVGAVSMPTRERGGAAPSVGVEISQASRLFDARNHDTLAALDRYAGARSDPESALGPKAYELRIDLFTRFGAYMLTRDLLEQEAARLGVPLPAGSAERDPDVRK